ncbi:MAG: 1-(5-phosphoribosyl)-5-[(5-phosphoribosylamino)methylideneamino]imidazole-4-carboxamide isomerase [Verrucomicrobiota bacterium]
MRILPAIDLRSGQVVRLEQGRADAQTTYSDDPVSVALDWQARGAEELHVVDLDGAFDGRPRNLDAVHAIAKALDIPLELGGGLRTGTDVEAALQAGAGRVVLGTAACEDLDLLQRLVGEFGGSRIAVGIDARDGNVRTKGWTQPSKWDAVALTREVSARGVGTVIYTDIETDGMFTGPNLGALKEVMAASSAEVIASGGVASLEHIKDLRALGGLYGAIVGKALYDKRLSLETILSLG